MNPFRVDFSLRGIPVLDSFVARDAEVTRLAQIILPTSTDQMRRKVCILHGLGGVGKTQLAVEFVRQHQRSYSAVFWIDGSTKEKLRRGIADIALRLPQGLFSERARSPSKEIDEDLDKIVQEVLRWFSQPSNDQWLLIFDNVDREFCVQPLDPEAFDVNEYFPDADQGSILITSRLANLWNLRAADIKLEPVTTLQGENILTNRVGRAVEGEWIRKQIKRTLSNFSAFSGSSELVTLLQGLPLAISQAGAYMRETGTNLPTYIHLYNKKWTKLME